MESSNPYQTPGANVYDIHEGNVFDETHPLSPKGRFGRLSYLAWSLLIGVVFGFLIFILVGGFSQTPTPVLSPSWSDISLQILASLILIVLSIRRLHDINASGWWAVFIAIPIVSIIPALILIFKAGTPGTNNYGPMRITRGWEMVVGYITIGLLVLSVVGIIAAIILPALAS